MENSNILPNKSGSFSDSTEHSDESNNSVEIRDSIISAPEYDRDFMEQTMSSRSARSQNHETEPDVIEVIDPRILQKKLSLNRRRRSQSRPSSRHRARSRSSNPRKTSKSSRGKKK